MSLVLKGSPVGEDVPINTIQNALYDGLVTNGNWTNYESYHRAYKNETSQGIRPEVFTGITSGNKENEYKEVFMDDGFNATSFFLIPNNIPVIDDIHTANISIIFQADLSKLYPTSPHRFDAEMHNEIENILKNLDGSFSFIDTHTSIDDVYAGLDTSKVNWDDMQKFHVVRFEIEATYQQVCNPTFATTGPVCDVSVSVITTPVTSIGGDEGTASAIVTGDQGTLTYLWTTVDGSIPAGQETEQTADGLTEGTYSVLVTDDFAGGCTDSASGTVVMSDCAISIDSIAVVAPTVFGGSDGTATATVSGSTGPVAFEWSDGQLVNPAVGLPSGAIGVMARDTDIEGCQDVGVAVIPPGAAWVFKTTQSSSTTLSVTNGAFNLLTWTSVSTVDGTIVETGDSVTFAWATDEEHVVTVRCADPDLVTEFHATQWRTKKITFLNLGGLANLTGTMSLISNNITTLINAPITNTITVFDVTNNNLVSFNWDAYQQCATLAIQGNNSLVTLTLTGIAVPLTSLMAFNTALVTIDLSSFSDTSISASVIVHQTSVSPTLVTLVSPFTATGKMTNIDVQDTAIVTLDLTNTTRWTDTATIKGDDMLSLETIVPMTTTIGKINHKFDNCDLLTGADLSGLFDLLKWMRFLGNASFSSLVLPPIALTSQVSILITGSVVSGYINVNVITNFWAFNSQFSAVDNNSKPAGVVNHEIVDVATAVAGESPGGDFTARSLFIAGATNAAPDATSGGFDGLQGVIDAVAQGVTMSTN